MGWIKKRVLDWLDIGALAEAESKEINLAIKAVLDSRLGRDKADLLTNRIEDLEDFRSKAIRTINEQDRLIHLLIAREHNRESAIKKENEDNELFKADWNRTTFCRSNWLRDIPEPGGGSERSAFLRSDSTGVQELRVDRSDPDTKSESVQVEYD